MNPWEETWRHERMPDHGPDYFYVRREDGSFVGAMDRASVARLAAAAPELVRALLAIEADTSDYCPMCGFRFGGTHEEFCPWDAALRKAGVR